MKNRKQLLVLRSAALLLAAVLAATDNVSSIAGNPNLSKVTFLVS